MDFLTLKSTDIESLSKRQLIDIIFDLKEKYNKLVTRILEHEKEDSDNNNESTEAHRSSPQKTSENSSIPSSKDIAKGKVQTENPQKRGPKYKHEGVSKKTEPNPDHILFIPIKKCPRTGKPINSNSTSYQPHQIFELIPGALQVVEIRRQITTGPDGKTVIAPNPDGIKDNQRFGPYLKSVVAQMRYQYHIEWESIKLLLTNLFGVASISQGALNTIFEELKKEFEIDYNDIKNHIKNAEVKGADETGIRVNGDLAWMWLFNTNDAAYYQAADTRGHTVPEEVLGNKFKGVLVTDFFSAYSEKYFKGTFQKCVGAHLLRDLKFADAINNGEKGFSAFLIDILYEAIALKNDCIFNSADYVKIKDGILTKFEKLLDNGDEYCLNKVERRLLKRSRKYRKHFFNFLEIAAVPYDNNSSERDIRKVVIFRNIYNGFQTLDSAQRLAVIFSVLQTCRKRGKDTFERIKEAFGCNKFVSILATAAPPGTS